MLLEFRNREPKAYDSFTISWSFLQSLLSRRPQFKDIFRVFVDTNLLEDNEDDNALLSLMKGTFEEKYVAQS